MSLVAVILLFLSVSLTVRIGQLQQDLRQRASGPSCQANVGADCGNNGKSCCAGLACVPKQNGNGGKCQFISAPAPTNPPYVPPSETNPTSGEPGPTSPGSDNTTGIGGIGSAPAPVQCGPNGCGWSPRPEGEKSTTNPPGIQVCTLTFSGPKQLVGVRLSSTSIRFSWWPTPGGADKQFIQYGLESGKPQWGLMNLSGNQGEVVVNDLPANKIIWAQIRAYRGNCYEDTDWVSVQASKPYKPVAYVTTAPQQTVVPTSIVTVQPTIVATISPTDTDSTVLVKSQAKEASFFWGTLIAILFALGYMLRKFLFLTKRRKKKE